MTSYRYRLLRYAPTISGEFYNVAVVLYDAAGRIVDARFAADFDRMVCNPAVELAALQALRDEFEEQRLLGEGFHAYFENLSRNLSDSLQATELKAFEGDEASGELDRLEETYLATPSGLADAHEVERASGRRSVRLLMGETFERHGILGPGLVEEGVEAPYGGSRLVFRFDYGYEVSGGRRLLHALGVRNAVRDASQLSFVMDRLGGDGGPAYGLTTVYEEGVADEALEVLALGEIRRIPTGDIDQLAASVKSELGL